MRTATTKFVTLFDILILVGVCTCGVIAGLYGLNNAREINRKLCEADKELELFNDQTRDRKRGIIMVSVVYITMTGMIILDIISRNRSTLKTKVALEVRHKGRWRHYRFIIMRFSNFLISFGQNPMKFTLYRIRHFTCSITS